MSDNIEWASFPTSFVTPLQKAGEIEDQYGNKNEDLAIQVQNCVIEGTREQWREFAESIIKQLDADRFTIVDAGDRFDIIDHLVGIHAPFFAFSEESMVRIRAKIEIANTTNPNALAYLSWAPGIPS